MRAHAWGPLVRTLCALLALGLAAPAPLRAAPSSSVGEHALGLLDELRIRETGQLLEELRKERPAAAETALVEGGLAFNQGRYAEAAERLKVAEEGLGKRSPLGREARALGALAASTAEATRALKPHPAPHFTIYAGDEDTLLVPYATDALERAWRALADDFGDSSDGTPEPIRVEIYGEVADLARVSALTLHEIETSGTIALCKYNRLMIVSPRALVAGYPWLDTLNHEYTHFVVSRISHNQVPIWLQEGLAKFQERRWRGPSTVALSPSAEHLLATGLAKGRLITLEQMHPSMAKLPSQEDTALAFAEVYMLVAYLKQTIGWDGLRRVIALLRDGKSDAQALATVAGRSFVDLQRDWRSWLGTQKLRTWPGLFPTELRFRKAGASKRAGAEDDDLNGAEAIRQTEAKRFARLGAMLRARGRLAAAAAEYEKAQARLGPANPQVTHTLGRVYLELEQPDRAIATVEPALAAYPDQAGPHATLGRSYLAKGRLDDAERQLLDALAISPFDPAIHCGLERIDAARTQAGIAIDASRRQREADLCRELSR